MFDQQDQPAFSRYAKTLAGYSDSLSEKLRDKDLKAVVSEAQDIGRRQPALVVGGAIAAGFVLARFLRSSGTSRPNQAASQSSPPRLSSDRNTGASRGSAADHDRIG